VYIRRSSVSVSVRAGHYNLIIQLFNSQLLGLYPDYGATPVILLCEAMVISYLGLAIRPSSGMLGRSTRHARYLLKTHALHWQAVTTTIILFDMWENDCDTRHS